MVLDKCLQIFSEPQNHTFAENKCRSNGGTLVIIQNAIQNRAISKFASDNNLSKIWIGVYCFGSSTSSCYYDDFSGPVSIGNNFAPGSQFSGCVSMVTTGSQSGKWYSSSCNGVNGSNPYICEMPTTTNGTINVAESCVNYDGYCYYMTHDAPLEVAESICQENNGHVASINSQHENDFIKNTFSSVYFLMLGAREYFPNVYAWSDGSLFEDFDNRYPFDIADNTRPCLVMATDTGLWMRAGCAIQQSFVCKVPLEAKTIEGNSHCNSTMLMAPTTITSYGYNIGSKVFTPCTYQIISPGSYLIQIYFVDIQNSTVEVFDENGKQIALATSRTTVYALSNFVTVVHKDGGLFKAKVLVA